MRTWSQVKPKVEAEIAKLKDTLATAPLADVLWLQSRVAALQSVLRWFEEPAKADRQISADEPVNY